MKTYDRLVDFIFWYEYVYRTKVKSKNIGFVAERYMRHVGLKK